MPHIWSASRYEGFNDGMAWDPPDNIEELRPPLERAVAQWQQGINFTWTIETNDTGTFVGRMAIRIHGDGRGAWSIGYWVHPIHQGKGYAVESARALLQFGFNKLNANTIVASHAKCNQVSGAVLIKIGMVRTGETTRGFKKQGVWVAEYDYAITRNEYLENSGT